MPSRPLRAVVSGWSDRGQGAVDRCYEGLPKLPPHCGFVDAPGAAAVEGAVETNGRANCGDAMGLVGAKVG
jgi:hypothetical protein